MVLEKTLESPLDCKEIQPVHPRGDQPCDFFGRNDAKAETPALWPPHVKSWLIGKDPDAGRDWGQEKKGMTEDEMAGWHHWLYGHGFGWTPRVCDGQGGLACCDSWGCKESDRTERLNWTELKGILGSPSSSVVKNLPAVQETWVWYLGWETPLEKETATHSSILAWKVLWREEPSGLQSIGLQRVGTTEHTHTQSVIPVVREIKTVFIIGSIFSSLGLLKKKHIFVYQKQFWRSFSTAWSKRKASP